MHQQIFTELPVFWIKQITCQ